MVLLLAQRRINGDLNEEQFKSYLEDEQIVFEAELHAIAIINKAMAQKATTNTKAMKILEKAIKSGISLIL